ncbi:MAG: PPC domain-containing protein [Gemmataceae bacterium]|nr:PPC domain-containing protein [Gemmataceae bacterium]
MALVEEPVFWIMDADGDVGEGDLSATIFPGPWIDPGFVPPLVGTVQGNLHPSATTVPDVDFFTFAAEPARLISITLTGAAVLDGVEVRLLDAAGNVVAQSTPEAGAEDRWAGVSFDYYSSAGGVFYVQVGPGGDANDDGETGYCLTIQVAPDPYNEHEPNDTLADANPIEITSTPLFWLMGVMVPADEAGFFAPPWPWQHFVESGNINGNLDPRDGGIDVDCFRFESGANRIITVSIQGDAVTAGAVVELLDADGNVLAVAQNAAVGDDDFAWITAAIDYFTQGGGTFYVRVSPGLDGAATGYYWIEVYLTTDPFREKEPNNDFDSANPVELVRLPELVYPLAATFAAVGPILDPGAATELIGPGCGWFGQRLPKFSIGHANGDLNGSATAGPFADVDYFTFYVPAPSTLRLDLAGPLAEHGGRITLYDADHNQLAVGLGLWPSVTWSTTAAGTFFVRIDSESVSDAAAKTDYHLTITATPLPTPTQGPDETEPNDTLDQADLLPLFDRCFGPATRSFRTGSALGIAGGEQGDVDVYRFDVRAGEQVNVTLDSLGFDHGGNPGRPVLARLQIAPVSVTILDAAGNVVGTATDLGTGLARVSFQADDDGTYYAVVTVNNAAPTGLLRYRLAVLVSGGAHPEFVTAAFAQDRDPPFVHTLKPGESFTFTDAGGDRVKISWKGGKGIATVTFTGSQADGSDIASIVLDQVKGGTLRVQTKGHAQVGAVTVHGQQLRRGSARVGEIKIDGDLGGFTSNADVGALLVKGTLGGVAAPTRNFGRIKAGTGDSGLIITNGVRKLNVANDFAFAFPVAPIQGITEPDFNDAPPGPAGLFDQIVGQMIGDGEPWGAAQPNAERWLGFFIDALLSGKKNFTELP